MRLICPNCDAEYEVDDSVIPQDGRDVQCSSCGQTWFQKSAAQLLEAELPKEAAPEPAPEPEPQIEAEAEPHQEPVVDAEPETKPEPEQEPQSEPEPRKPDEAVLDVLRQEAELETAARQHDAQGGIETQPDLGIDQGDGSEATAVNQRTARLRGIEPELEKNKTRSDLLPDIEEINSTLQAESDVETQEALSGQKRDRSGFRLGFGLIIILATILLLAYIYAPLISEKIPAIEAFMTSYVDTVNVFRDWLDNLMKAATDKMSGDAAGS